MRKSILSFAFMMPLFVGELTASAKSTFDHKPLPFGRDRVMAGNIKGSFPTHTVNTPDFEMRNSTPGKATLMLTSKGGKLRFIELRVVNSPNFAVDNKALAVEFLNNITSSKDGSHIYEQCEKSLASKKPFKQDLKGYVIKCSGFPTAITFAVQVES
jgi:hypothetical protein